MPVTVKRTKATSTPPHLCDGDCYWQDLARLLRAEINNLRLDLIRAKAERKKSVTSVIKLSPHGEDVEPIHPGKSADDDDDAKDLLDLFNRR